MTNLRKIAGVLLAAALLTVAAAAPAHADGPETITDQGNGLCLQPEGDFNGALVLQVPCVAGRRSQTWYRLGTGAPYFLLQNGLAGRLCMDVRDGINENGTLIQLWECRGSTSMMWSRTVEYANIYKVRSKLDNPHKRCLDGFDAAQVPPRTKLWDCGGGRANYFQQWAFAG